MAIGGIGGAGGLAELQSQRQGLDGKVRQERVGPEATLGQVPSGSLIISDGFIPSSSDSASHGETVAQSARFDGFRGPVRTLAMASSTTDSQRLKEAEDGFYNFDSTPEETRSNIGSYAQASATHVLNTEIQMVQKATDSGAKNSALNLSQGRSRADISTSIYSKAASSWADGLDADQQKFAEGVSQKFADAYGLDMAKLSSKDPKISGPERQKLQEGIIGTVDSSINDSPQVSAAKKRFATEVNRFESNNNSVVISSGNEGDLINTLKKDASGLTPRNLPKNFDTNLLDTPQATMVGATRWFENENGLTERVANYSSVQSGVDIFASGSVATKVSGRADTFGTSFAAPRVAATMATLHKLNPSMSSSQIENLMKSSLTHNLNSGNGSQVDVLDYQMSSNLMVGRAN